MQKITVVRKPVVVRTIYIYIYKKSKFDHVQGFTRMPDKL